MANTYSQLYIQVVFAVKNRSSLIDPSWESHLYSYIGASLKHSKCKPLAINGMPDHIHIFFGLNPQLALSDLVREIKKSSNSFIKEQGLVKGNFYWQEGYGAFSYSRSQISHVCQYIQDQKKHHTRKTFREEYIEFLKAFKIEYNESYLFDWIND